MTTPTDAETPQEPVVEPPAQPAATWQPLPPRGATLAALGSAMALVFPFGFLSLFLSRATDVASPWLVVPAAVVLGAVIGAWLGIRRHRRMAWKLDEEGFALRRGNWWRSETLVPISRVQHLDLKRGPLERSLALSTLVVHTAGTKLAALSVPGLDAADAERLRDRLAHQLDHDDAL